jgi:osmoprotectant transport system substrate-binding protein
VTEHRTARRPGPARRHAAAFLAGPLALALLAACQPGATAAGPGGQGAQPGTVVVASFNFPESELLAAIYGLAIRHAGIPVRLRLNLGPRELVEPALEQGLVDLVPEYLGTALTSIEPHPSVDMSDPAAVRAALARALAIWGVQVLTPARAQDQNGVVVTRATAARLRLRTVSDLRRPAAGLILGGPPECPARPYCLPGLRDTYGLRFARFLPFDTEQQRVTALQDGVVNVAVLFTTDGNLAASGLVLLADNRHLQPAENIVPVVRAQELARYGKRLAGAVNAVSAKLTSAGLLFLDWRVEVAGNGVLAEARAWLERHGILPRPA